MLQWIERVSRNRCTSSWDWNDPMLNARWWKLVRNTQRNVPSMGKRVSSYDSQMHAMVNLYRQSRSKVGLNIESRMKSAKGQDKQIANMQCSNTTQTTPGSL